MPRPRRILQAESLRSQHGAGGMARNGESIVRNGGGKPILQAARAPTVRGQLEGVDMAGKGGPPRPVSCPISHSALRRTRLNGGPPGRGVVSPGKA